MGTDNTVESLKVRRYRLYMKSWLVKLLGGLTLAFGILLFLATYKDVIPFYTDSMSSKIESLWKRDMVRLVQAQTLPKEWGDIGEVIMNPVSPKAKEWASQIEVPVGLHKGGQHRLEIFFDEWKDEQGQFGVVIQYSLIHIPSKNTIWEGGRTLVLSENK